MVNGNVILYESELYQEKFLFMINIVWHMLHLWILNGKTIFMDIQRHGTALKWIKTVRNKDCGITLWHEYFLPQKNPFLREVGERANRRTF